MDYLRGEPKTEVKSLLAAKKKADEISGILRESYSDKLPVEELKRMFLEQQQIRRIRRRLCMHAVDHVRRFMRLKRRDLKLC